MEIIQTNALITINDTLWVQLLSFLCFLFLINRIMFRPVMRTMTERKIVTEDMRNGIQQASLEMDQLLSEAAEEERRIRKKAHEERDALLDKGSKEAAAVLETAKVQIGKVRTETEAQLSRDLAEARKKISTESLALARTIMESVLERPLP